MPSTPVRLKAGLTSLQPSGDLRRGLGRLPLHKFFLSAVEGWYFLTAGGTGAGKTTAIQSPAGMAGPLEHARLIYDSNFHRVVSNRRRLRMAVDAGSRAVIIFVHRHPVEAYLEGVVPRALMEGRTVPITGHLRMHRDSLSSFLEAHKAFAADPRIAFKVLNNTGHPTEAFPLDLDYLRNVKYKWLEIHDVIKRGLDGLYERGKIPQTLYKASLGGS